MYILPISHKDDWEKYVGSILKYGYPFRLLLMFTADQNLWFKKGRNKKDG